MSRASISFICRKHNRLKIGGQPGRYSWTRKEFASGQILFWIGRFTPKE